MEISDKLPGGHPPAHRKYVGAISTPERLHRIRDTLQR